MNARSWRRWPALAAAGGVLLAATACAPNSAKAPVQPRLATAQSDGEREDSRYGALLRMAASTRAGGDPAAAVQLYQQAIRLEAKRPDAYLLLGDTLIDLEAYDDAATIFRQALGQDDESLAAHRGYARALVALNRPEAAIPHYQTVLEETPDDIQTRNGLGVAYDLAGQHEAAQAVYRQGLEVAPDSMVLRNNLGLSLALAGQYDDAIRMLRAVADEPGAKPRNRQNLALAYGLKGDLAAAERISRLDLDEAAVQNNLAYFATLAAVDSRLQRARALGVHAPDRADRAGDAAASQRLGAVVLDGQGLALGLTPTGRWFVNLGDYADGGQASSAWRKVRTAHGDLVSGLTRLAGTQDGPQPLLVGPLGTAEQAQDLCGDLRRHGYACRAVPL